jgi:hypothetical protein
MPTASVSSQPWWVRREVCVDIIKIYRSANLSVTEFSGSVLLKGENVRVCKLQTPGFNLPASTFKLLALGFKLPASNCKLRETSAPNLLLIFNLGHLHLTDEGTSCAALAEYAVWLLRAVSILPALSLPTTHYQPLPLPLPFPLPCLQPLQSSKGVYASSRYPQIRPFACVCMVLISE